MRIFSVSILAMMLCLIGAVNMSAQPPQGQRGPGQMPDWAQDLSKRISIDAYGQAGFTYQHNGNVENDELGNKKDYNTFDLKRVFLVVAVPITDRWFAMFMHDFSSEVHEYWTSYRFTNNKAFSAKLGQFKHAYTIENSMSPTELEAIDVCSEGVTYLAGCGSDRLIGTTYGRDLGLEFLGETNNGKFAYRVGIMNGQGVNKKDGNNEKDFIGKVDFKPIPELTLSASGQIGRGHAVDRSSYVNIAPGQDYKRNRWSAGFFYKSNRLRVRGEYLEGRDDDVTSRGAYVTSAIPVAKHLDVIGSYDFFNYNVKEDMDQHKLIAGLQYWFYKNCRVQLQYVYKSAYLEDYAIYNPMGGLVAKGKSFEKGANHAIMCQLQVRLK